MRPLRIEFAAFGSYPGEVSVDFAALAARGLFVVTGDTGTGKSTIFDAMSYALFGDMPLKPGDDIRSHHAEAGRATYARFTFAIDDAVYVAERAPAQERAAIRGSKMVIENAKVSLTRVDADGTTTVLATKVRAMADEVARVVGLDAEQFQRVMLLPQGEVARFLLDGSADREKLLSALFGGGVYERIGMLLQQEAGALGKQVSAVDETLRHHLTNARDRMVDLRELLELTDTHDDPVDREALGAFHGACRAPLDSLRAAADAAAARATEDRRVLTEAEAAAARLRDAISIRAELEALAAREPSVVVRAEEAERSRRARPVVQASERARASASVLADAETTREDSERALRDLLTTLDLPLRLEPATALSEDLDSLAARVRAEEDLLNARSLAAATLATCNGDLAQLREKQAVAVDALTTADGELVDISGRLVELSDAPTALSALTEEATQLETALLAASEREIAAADSAARAAELLEAQNIAEEVLRGFIDTTAPRLAAQLAAGSPCPVCGSAEHPQPAAAEGGAPVDFAAVTSAQSRVEEARAAVTAAEERRQALRAQLAQWADTPVEELRALVAHTAALQREAVVRLEELERLKVEQTRLEAQRDALRRAVDQGLGLIQAAEEAAAVAEEAMSAATRAAEAVDPDRHATLVAALSGLRAQAADLATHREEMRVAAAAAAQDAQALSDILAGSGFPAVDDARAALMAERDEHDAREELTRLTADLERCRGGLQALETQGLPESAPDVEGFTLAAEASSKEATQLRDRCTLAERAASELAEALNDHDRIGAASEDLRRRAQLTERAQKICRGQVGAKVSLQRWVLGRELDRVVAAASAHLSQMTAGRYTLRRVTELAGGQAAKGLDLEVLDAHTGRARSPRSLSGGEQFQASLALALGLADVVSQGGSGSGRRIEALFIDEGFGSLDPRALDDAIETLHQLHASGRMVGAITHVEAMKERLHPGIVVTRLPDGRGSTLRINP